MKRLIKAEETKMTVEDFLAAVSENKLSDITEVCTSFLTQYLNDLRDSVGDGYDEEEADEVFLGFTDPWSDDKQAVISSYLNEGLYAKEEAEQPGNYDQKIADLINKYTDEYDVFDDPLLFTNAAGKNSEIVSAAWPLHLEIREECESFGYEENYYELD